MHRFEALFEATKGDLKMTLFSVPLCQRYLGVEEFMFFLEDSVTLTSACGTVTIVNGGEAKGRVPGRGRALPNHAPLPLP